MIIVKSANVPTSVRNADVSKKVRVILRRLYKMSQSAVA